MRTLDSEHADTIRRTVNGILQQAKPPKANITKEMQEALKNLKQDDTIIILPADKGRFSVVLDTDTLSLKRSGHQSEIIYNKTKPRHKQPPRIYGLPKIHKPDIPLGPIVSCIFNTSAYDFLAHLADILSLLTGKLDYSVINSTHLVSIISH